MRSEYTIYGDAVAYRGPRIIKQVAALPYRTGPGGSPQVLLITSRDTRRWVIPKGNPIRGLPSHLAAAHEAFEEAGIAGVAAPAPIGTYGYDKLRANGSRRAARVEVFPLRVRSRYEDWPEQHQRETRWFGLAEAADAVDEPELRAIIAGFRVPGARPPGWLTRLRGWLRDLPRRGRSANTSLASPPATARSS